MKESIFQRHVIRRLKATYENCIVLKNDAMYIQGIPDLLVVYKNHYAFLEVKKSKDAHRQPNQEYYIQLINNMGGFAAFIYPENEEAIFNGIQKTFES